MIAQLERDLDVQLFDRSRSQIGLTQAGELLKTRASYITEEIERAVRDVRLVGKGGSGVLRVSFVGSATHGPFPTLIKRFRCAFPEVDLRLSAMNNAESHEQLITRAIDVAVVRPSLDDATLRQQLFVEEPLVAALHENAAKELGGSIRLAALKDQPFVLFPRKPRPCFADMVLGLCSEAGFQPPHIVWAPDYQTAISLVAVGEGISIVPACCEAAHRPGVSFCHLSDAQARTRLSICARTDNQSPQVFKFLDFARSFARSLASGQAAA
jgi:DNA-binding transcriptional LysR family regulator